MSDKRSLPPKKFKSAGRPAILKAIFFDLDGVLLDSNRIHHRAFRETLGPLGIRHVDYRRIAGMKTREAMKVLLRNANRHLTPGRVAALTAKKQVIAQDLFKKHLPLRLGCIPVLKRLHRRFRLGLVSSSRRASVHYFLRASRTRPLFTVVLSGDDVAKAKPSSAIYREALRRMNLKSSEVLVVEDAIAGVQAARRLNMRTVAMRGTVSDTELRRAGVEKIFATLMAVARYAKHL